MTVLITLDPVYAVFWVHNHRMLRLVKHTPCLWQCAARAATSVALPSAVQGTSMDAASTSWSKDAFMTGAHPRSTAHRTGNHILSSDICIKAHSSPGRAQLENYNHMPMATILKRTFCSGDGTPKHQEAEREATATQNQAGTCWVDTFCRSPCSTHLLHSVCFV